MPGGELHHLVGAVVGVGGVIIGHDADRVDALFLQHCRIGHQPVDHRHHIGAMIADEGDKKALFAHQPV